MQLDSSLIRLGHCLSGAFSNRQQALADPVWFVQLRLWCRPISVFRQDSLTFFLEQVNVAVSHSPYRQRVLRLRQEGTQLIAQYYALKQPDQFQGAAQAPERLAAIAPEDLRSLTGGCLLIQRQATTAGDRYEARHRPGERCQVEINGQPKQVELGFDALSPQPRQHQPPTFWMYDKGYDPHQQRYTWGALHGPFRLEKTVDYSNELRLHSSAS